MIVLTKEQFGFIDYHSKRIGKERILKEHVEELEDGGYQHNTFMNSVSIEQMAKILYVENSYQVEKTYEEKVEGWNEYINTCSNGYEYPDFSAKDMIDLAKDFGIELTYYN